MSDDRFRAHKDSEVLLHWSKKCLCVCKDFYLLRVLTDFTSSESSLSLYEILVRSSHQYEQWKFSSTCNHINSLKCMCCAVCKRPMHFHSKKEYFLYWFFSLSRVFTWDDELHFQNNAQDLQKIIWSFIQSNQLASEEIRNNLDFFYNRTHRMYLKWTTLGRK